MTPIVFLIGQMCGLILTEKLHMKPRYCRLLAVLVLLACFCLKALGLGVSSVTNGFRLVIAAKRQGSSASVVITNDIIRFDDDLLWMPFSETNSVELSYPLDLAYLVRIKMTDASGKEVPKTSIGKRCGSKFEQLRAVTDTRVYPSFAEGPYKENPELIGVKSLRAPPVNGISKSLTPKELFRIESPGIYNFEIQMQMFYPNANSTNAWKKDVLRFPPVTIRVERPREP